MNILTRYGIIPASTVRFEPILLKHDAGLMDFSVTGATNLYWVFPDGTTSTAIRPAKTVDAGITKVYCDNWDSPSLVLSDNDTNSIFTGSLADLQGKLIGTLYLSHCTNVTGSLADLQGKLTGSLSLDACVKVTGSLADLQGKLIGTLNLYRCANITGSLADLQGKITNTLCLSNLVNVHGVYTPIGAGTPAYTYLSNTGLSASDMDATLINYANAEIPKSNGTFTADGMTRTSASDTAIATLVGRGWTVSGLTKI